MESQTRNTESFDSRLGIELEIGLGLGICLNVKPCIESDSKSDSKFRPFGIFGIIGKPHMGVVFQKLGFHKNRDFAHFYGFQGAFWGISGAHGHLKSIYFAWNPNFCVKSQKMREIPILGKTTWEGLRSVSVLESGLENRDSGNSTPPIVGLDERLSLITNWSGARKNIFVT